MKLFLQKNAKFLSAGGFAPTPPKQPSPIANFWLRVCLLLDWKWRFCLLFLHRSFAMQIRPNCPIKSVEYAWPQKIFAARANFFLQCSSLFLCAFISCLLIQSLCLNFAWSQFMLSYISPQVWNLLPLSLLGSKTLSLFKKGLKGLFCYLGLGGSCPCLMPVFYGLLLQN